MDVVIIIAFISDKKPEIKLWSGYSNKKRNKIKLLFLNINFIIQEDLEREMENINCRVTNEFFLSFQELELEFIKLQRNLISLIAVKRLQRRINECTTRKFIMLKERNNTKKKSKEKFIIMEQGFLTRKRLKKS